MDKRFKSIGEISFGEYDATNYRNSSNKELFNRLFFHDEKLDEILESNKYYILGDKGTGKTAYSVYLANNEIDNTLASIIYMMLGQIRLYYKVELIVSKLCMISS